MCRAVKLAEKLPVFGAAVVYEICSRVFEAAPPARGLHSDANVGIVRVVRSVGPPQVVIALGVFALHICVEDAEADPEVDTSCTALVVWGTDKRGVA